MRDDSLLHVDIMGCMSLYKKIKAIQDSIIKNVVLVAFLIPFSELKNYLRISKL
jgi:hypothetical protein